MSFSEAIEEAVNLRGENFVYPAEWRHANTGGGCNYVHDGEPACIIGLALNILGIDVETLATKERLSARVVVNYFRYQFPKLGITEAEVQAAGYAQLMQDSGASWGECLGVYRKELTS